MAQVHVDGEIALVQWTIDEIREQIELSLVIE